MVTSLHTLHEDCLRFSSQFVCECDIHSRRAQIIFHCVLNCKSNQKVSGLIQRQESIKSFFAAVAKIFN